MALRQKIRVQALISDLSRPVPPNIHEMAKKYQVSEMTIRRDLKYIEENHLLNQVRRTTEQPISTVHTGYVYEKEDQTMAEEKDRIAKAAVDLIEPRDVLLLDTGTTVARLSALLPDNMPLTVITNSYPVIVNTIKKSNINLIVLGGYFHAGALSFECPESIQQLNGLRATKAFLSTTGVERKPLGITCSNQYELPMKTAVIRSSMQHIILTDSSKFGVLNSSYYASFEDTADIVVTDKGLSQEWIEYTESCGIRLILV